MTTFAATFLLCAGWKYALEAERLAADLDGLPPGPAMMKALEYRDRFFSSEYVPAWPEDVAARLALAAQGCVVPGFALALWEALR
jgi:hypothetical protein